MSDAIKLTGRLSAPAHLTAKLSAPAHLTAKLNVVGIASYSSLSINGVNVSYDGNGNVTFIDGGDS